MYFEEAFEKLKTSLGKAKIDVGDGHYAVQVRITDFDCGGTFYVEQKDNAFYIEPYNYFDFDTDIEASFKDLKSVADGKTDIKKAVDDGKVIVTGNLDALFYFAGQLKKAPAKRASKKAVTEKKPAAKKAAPKKAADDGTKAPAPKAKKTVKKATK